MSIFCFAPGIFKYINKFIFLICYLFLSSSCYADEIKTSMGFGYFSGRYDQEEKTSIYLSSFDLQYKSFPWESRLSLPMLKIDGFGGIDGNGNIIGDGRGERRTDTGIGDVQAQLSYYYVPPYQFGFFKSSVVKLSAKIKIPTADKNKGLGTGEYDYTVESLFIKNVGRFSPFSTVGYTYVGKTSGSILNNRFYGNIGTVYRLKPKLNIGLMYTYKQASSDRVESDQKIIAFSDWKIADTPWSIEAYALTGLTNAAVDRGVGFSLSYRFRL